MIPTEPDIDLRRPACGEAIAALQEFLDGELLVESAAVRSHRDICQECREEWQFARLFPKPVAVVVPSELAVKTERAVTRDRTRRRFQRWSAAVLIPATAAVFAVVFWPTPQPTRIEGQIIAVVAMTPAVKDDVKFDESLSNARSAMASLKNQVIPDRVDVTLPPITLPKVEPMGEADPAWDRLADAGDGLKTGVKPLANSARRAMTMLFRATEAFSSPVSAPRKN